MFNPKINQNTHVSVQLSKRDEPQTSLSNSVAMLATENTQLVKATANLSVNAVPPQRIYSLLKEFLGVQKQMLMEQPSSSQSQHLNALNALEQRNFKPSSRSALHIPFTGKALGGMPPRRTSEQRRTEILLKIEDLTSFVQAATEQVQLTETETIPELRALFDQAEPNSDNQRQLFNMIDTASRQVITLRIQVTEGNQRINSLRDQLRQLGG